MSKNVRGTSAMSISKSLFFRFAAGVLLLNLCVTGPAVFSLYQSLQQYRQQAATQSRNLSHSLSVTIEGIIDITGLALSSVAKEMERYIGSGGIDSRALNHYIAEQKAHIPELDGLRIADARGEFTHGDRVVAGSWANIADRDYFITARNNPTAGLIISHALVARSSRKWVINLVRRINNPDGTFAGVVVGAVSLDYLSNLFSSFDLGKQGVITLLDREPAIIVRYPHSSGGGGNIGIKTVSDELKALTKAGNTSGTYKALSRIDAVERTFSFNKISEYPLYVNVGLADKDFLLPWQNEARKTLSLAALFAAGSLISAWMIYRNRKREKMTEAELARYREHLEETVAERTAELESKNVRLAEEIVLRKRIEADLKKAAVIMDKMPDAVEWVSREGKILYVNDAACRMHGYSREELLTMSVPDLALHFSHEAWPAHWEELKRKGYLHFETVNKARDGREFPVEVTINYLEIAGVEYNCGIIRDISDRKEAEAEKQELMKQLGQSQKIESIGRLAGGIAHDFNNLLTPILGYAELLKSNMMPGSRGFEKVDNIMQAADKARVLTQQLLSFGRKQILEMKTVDMNDVILSFYEILRRTIRESIDIQLHLTNTVYGIRADRNQLEQVIMNMTINAQDAIKDKGTITLETALTILDDEYARRHASVTPGRYLMFAITDTGCGMDQEALANIFEPFFTTKEVGKGSGLGLATVYGLVKQHEGHIWVYSEIGKGTVFKIYFPIVDDMPARGAAIFSDNLEINTTGDHTILLVEDNDMVRNLVLDVLENCGCTVIVAEGPRQALAKSRGLKIDLLLTDVVMPDMNGPELHKKLLESQQGMKVLYMSGYTNNVIVHHGVLDEGINFIQKPFAINHLAKKINTILNSALSIVGLV